MINNKKNNKNFQEISEQESLMIYFIKAFSILSVIAAHVNYIKETTIIDKYITSIWTVIGQVGVICFFILGGFLYTRKPNDNKIFWKKKFHNLILPWLICSSLTYFINTILTKQPIDIIKYVKWIGGYETWYYYIVVFLFCLFIFKYLYNSVLLLNFTIIINILSIMVKTINLSLDIRFFFLTDYLNPLNWIGFFSFGIIMRKYRIDKKIYNNKKFFFVSFIIMLITTYLIIKYQTFTYFHIFSTINSTVSFFVLYYIMYRLVNFKIGKYMKYIGTYTYCIYLLHMQIVQYLSASVPDSLIKYIFSPIVCLIFMLFLIQIGIYICNKISFGKKIKSIVGL